MAIQHQAPGVASAPPAPRQAPATAAQPALRPTVTPGTLPTQRALPTPGAPTPSTSTSRTAAPEQGAPASRHPRRTAVLVVGSSVLLLGALAAGIAVKLHRDAEAAAWAAAEARVALEVTSQQADERFIVAQSAAVDAAAHDAVVAAAIAQAGMVVSGAQGALAASPHAGDANLAALQQAADAVSASAASIGKGTSLAALQATQQAVQAPQQVAVEAQAAWQAAEDARIAAERAAAEQAAAAAAAQRSANRQSTPRAARSNGSAPAAAAAPAAEAPASAWVAGVESYGVSGLGAAINAQRVANGLPELSVGGSASLADHAAEMAAAGTIWHSGRDHIVGWVQPVSAEQMIQAYMNSPAHRAWILKEGKTKVSIGAVTYNGRLYTAMVFS